MWTLLVIAMAGNGVVVGKGRESGDVVAAVVSLSSIGFEAKLSSSMIAGRGTMTIQGRLNKFWDPDKRKKRTYCST
jgi:hypothetical protein